MSTRVLPRISAHALVSAVGLLLATVHLNAQEIVWARQVGTNFVDQANGAATFDGNVYVVGNVTFPAKPPLNGAEKNVVVMRYESNGSVGWTHQFGSVASGRPTEDVATGVAVDSSGVYVAGYIAGALPPHSKASSSSDYDGFLRKYDLKGNELWTQQIGAPTTSSVQVFGVALDATGVYVAGYKQCCGPKFLDSPEGTPSGADAFVRKYDLRGAYKWTRQFGTAEQDQARAVAADSTGVYVAGMTAGTFSPIAGSTLSHGFDAFVRKYDVDGSHIWTEQHGGGGDEELFAVALGTSVVPVEGPSIGVLLAPPVIYIGGRTRGLLQGASGLWDAYLMQLDSLGKRQWTRQFGGVGDYDEIDGLAVGLTHLVVAGVADGALPAQTFGGGQDAFFRVYDFLGNEVRTLEFGNGLNDSATSVAAHGTGFYVAGSKSGAALGLSPLGELDAFIIKLSQPPLVPVPGPRPVPPRPSPRPVR